MNKFTPGSYAAKLKDPRWSEFRADYIRYRTVDDQSASCDNCGEETSCNLHVHHKVYRSGRDPWDYDFDDLRLICANCHSRIHEVEKRTRALVISLPPHETYELEDLLDELEEIQKLGLIQVAFARCKNTVRELKWSQREKSSRTLF